MRAVFSTSDSAIIQVRLRLLTGLLAYYLDNPHAAARELEQALPTLRTIGLGGDLWQAQRVLGWCWAALDRPAAEREALASETSAQLDRMIGSLEGTARTIFQLNKWTADEEYIASELNALARMWHAAATAPWGLRILQRWAITRRLVCLIEHIDRYKDRRTRTVVTGQAKAAAPVTLSLLWRLLTHPRDRVTLGFLVLPDRVLVTRIGRFRIDFGISPLTRLQIRELVSRWHKAVATAGAGRGLFLEEDDAIPEDSSTSERELIATRLATALQIPRMVETLPAHVRRITIVPDDSLHGFPFAALTLGNHRLIERYAINVAFEHAPALLMSRVHAHAAALVGVMQGGGQFRPLPGVRREIEAVREVLTAAKLPVHTLLDHEVTQETLSAALTSATHVHIAAHGIFTPDQPDRSGIVLDSSDSEPSILSLRDLAGLKLDGLQHITLASCWSADHFVLPGRWVISLPETLWRAGAQSILGSLWEVDDQVAVAFMQCFYTYATRYPRDIALQRAQIDCLSGRLVGQPDRVPIDPRYWACFVLYGDVGSTWL